MSSAASTGRPAPTPRPSSSASSAAPSGTSPSTSAKAPPPSASTSPSVLLTADNRRQFFVPRGFAHGFAVLEDDTLFAYKCDNLYCKESERGLRFDDPALGIDWPDTGVPPILSPKDTVHPLLAQIEPWEP